MLRYVPLGSALFLGILCLPAIAGGQSVEGRVFDASNDRPIAGAIIRLVDSAGRNVGATAADSIGRYELASIEAGRYRVRAEQIGYEPYESRQVDVQGARSVDLPMRPSPISLPRVEVFVDRLDRRISELTGLTANRLRIRPIRSATIREHVARGNSLSEMIRSMQISGLQVLRTAEGPCYQFRGRGCAPVYLDGARLTRSSPLGLPLHMVGGVLLLRPNEAVAYPQGAVHVLTIGFAG